jgi:threonine dehydratase
VGGGGLLSGCATIAKAIQPAIRIFGAEPESANDTYLSLRAGERVTVPHPDTIADGLRAPRPGVLTFPVLQQFAEAIALVTEDEIRETVKYLLLRLRVLVEPSGAVSAAAVLFGKLPPGIASVGVILSGGNMDFAQLAAF